MGYPMTYRRVVQRNHLVEGGYETVENGLLRGDLRRLEKDAVDGRAIASHIAEKLLLAPDLVTAVLKEFLEA